MSTDHNKQLVRRFYEQVNGDTRLTHGAGQRLGVGGGAAWSAAVSTIYAILLLSLAAFGAIAGRRIFSARRPWSVRSRLFCVTVVLLESGALLSGVGLLAGWFAPWMLLPLGCAYITMLPLPCYFPWVTGTRTRWIVRNVGFALFALGLLALGTELVPLSLFRR